ASQLLEVTSALLSSGEVDSLLVALVATSVSDPHALTEALSRARSEHPLVPVVLVAMGGLEVAPGQLPGITVFDTPDDAVGALAHAVRRAAWLDRPREDAEPPDEERAATASALAQDLTVKAGPSWLDADQMRELLSPYGLVPTGELVSSPLAAAKVAARTGFPVVVKVADPDVVHKTDRGLVRVGLQSGLEVSTAVRAFEAELNRSDVPVLVQPTVPGVEMALGVVRDPGFGPLVMVAAGGVATEVWNDRTFLLPPVTRQDAGRALQSLRIWPLLNGYRGSDRVDLDALEQAIQSLGQLAVDVPELAELDLNPVMANPRGAVLVDAKVRLAEAQHVDAGVPRQLRTRTPTAPRKEPQ
ncbi:MAG TPA: acetate--CoA ligase family protein, partial [Intrasporangium sp.]|nr:acetate--CoA ligase family protein [Intrasporangium sp.]